MRRLARRYQHLTGEIKDADTELHDLVATAAPGMTTLVHGTAGITLSEFEIEAAIAEIERYVALAQDFP